MQSAGGHRSQHEKSDFHGRGIERDIVRDIAHDSRRQPHVSNEIGSSVRHGESPAHRRAHLGLARFDRVKDAAKGTIIGVADGQTNKFAQKVRFGVAAERNADAIR